MPALPELARRLALAPWWALELLSSAKSFVDNPLLGSARLNRLGLHRVRLRAAHALSARRRAGLAAALAPAEREAFARDGYLVRHDLLPAADFAALREALLARPAPAREMLQGDTLTRRIALDPAFRRAVPALQGLIEHPLFRAATRHVAAYDREPWLYLQTILSQVRAAAPDPQTHLHADTFHPTMKAWFFLGEVAADEGPFTYVPGSHRLTPERLAWESRRAESAAREPCRMSARGSLRIEADELPALGLPPPRALAVPANTLVVADTFGFHARGPSLRPGLRIEVWAYDRRNPFWPASTDAPLAWLGLLPRRAPLYWAALDARERLGGSRNPWRDAGLKRAGDPAA